MDERGKKIPLPYTYGEEQERAFQTLKETVANLKPLTIIDPSKEVFGEVYACEKCLCMAITRRILRRWQQVHKKMPNLILFQKV